MKKIFRSLRHYIHNDLIRKSILLLRMQFVNIKPCKTVCLILGSTSNLTTLTATVLFLHPNCQVLNHCGRSILNNQYMDFLKTYTRKKLNKFIQFALARASSSYRFGSIRQSHAWGKLPPTIRKRYSGKKKHIKCLLWKEPHHVYNHIQNQHIDLIQLLEKEDDLRCLMPIRNPIDCALSIVRKTSTVKKKIIGSYKLHNINPYKQDGTKQPNDDLTYILIKKILDQIYQFGAYKEKLPNRFFYYFEHSIDKAMLIKLATFMKLEPNGNWLSDALLSMKIKPSYEHSDEYLDFYQKTVHEKFSDMPDLAGELLKFK